MCSRTRKRPSHPSANPVRGNLKSKKGGLSERWKQKRPRSASSSLFITWRNFCASLTSLVEQTFQDREIIAVNDGSTDHSLDILREFEQKYDFITVIDQKNRGMSKARNRGLSLARGEYICFIDSDDYVAPNFLERLYNACVENDAQISCCYYYYLFPNSGFTFEYPFRCNGVFTAKRQ